MERYRPADPRTYCAGRAVADDSQEAGRLQSSLWNSQCEKITPRILRAQQAKPAACLITDCFPPGLRFCCTRTRKWSQLYRKISPCTPQSFQSGLNTRMRCTLMSVSGKLSDLSEVLSEGDQELRNSHSVDCSKSGRDWIQFTALQPTD